MVSGEASHHVWETIALVTLKSKHDERKSTVVSWSVCCLTHPSSWTRYRLETKAFLIKVLKVISSFPAIFFHISNSFRHWKCIQATMIMYKQTNTWGSEPLALHSRGDYGLHWQRGTLWAAMWQSRGEHSRLVLRKFQVQNSARRTVNRTQGSPDFPSVPPSKCHVRTVSY